MFVLLRKVLCLALLLHFVLLVKLTFQAQTGKTSGKNAFVKYLIIIILNVSKLPYKIDTKLAASCIIGLQEQDLR